MHPQWFVYQILVNELNFRHVFQALDGTISGPRSWTGPLGRSCLSDVWCKYVVALATVRGLVDELPGEALESLSTDQEFLYRLARSVQHAWCPT